MTEPIIKPGCGQSKSTKSANIDHKGSSNHPSSSSLEMDNYIVQNIIKRLIYTNTNTCPIS